MKLANRIKELRESQGLLQRQLSAQLEIDTPMFSKIERGERRAKQEQVLKIAEILKVSPDELIALWLTDQIVDLVANACPSDRWKEQVLQALKMAETDIKNKKD
ncbi:helix-turn-helix domain-containing protein [Arenibacter lacus]|uniref:helix-turn-helix domain-containing protein n=1 Tax=Arenibacter lacus TaxID=2608629 RepID=UPI00123C91AB